MTPSGIKPATFRVVGQYVYQLRHHVPPPSYFKVLFYNLRVGLRKIMSPSVNDMAEIQTECLLKTRQFSKTYSVYSFTKSAVIDMRFLAGHM